jgi:hypothetical protein
MNAILTNQDHYQNITSRDFGVKERLMLQIWVRMLVVVLYMPGAVSQEMETVWNLMICKVFP